MDHWTGCASLAGLIRRVDTPLLEAAERAEELHLYELAAELFELATKLLQLRRQVLELPSTPSDPADSEQQLPF